jgi:hypothetical protein
LRTAQDQLSVKSRELEYLTKNERDSLSHAKSSIKTKYRNKMEVFKAQCEQDLDRKIRELQSQAQFKSELAERRSEIELQRDYIDIKAHEQILNKELEAMNEKH